MPIQAFEAGPDDFYPRPLRGGRLYRRQTYHNHELISIHALCEEGDGTAQRKYASIYIFLSTPSARRATTTADAKQVIDRLFLSTPSARRATPILSTFPP